MPSIRPISDLRNKFTEVSSEAQETAAPIFLTRNGVGEMVVMSMEAYENLQFESEVHTKLKEAEREAELTSARHSSKEVFAAMRDAVRNASSSEAACV